MNPELQQNIAIWRAKAARGELTLDEQIKAVEALREGRLAAQHAARDSASTSRKKVPAGPAISGEQIEADILDFLDKA